MNGLDRAPFFSVGGALGVNAPSYIERDADQELLACLLAGEFAYVLVSRQMGKSSLMIRTVARLHQHGVTAVVLDLNAVGHETTREQWYYSLLMQIARRLDLRSEVKVLWEQDGDLSPLQRWINVLDHLLLRVPEKRLVIFIDEIDQVRLLPFSADEFFAAVRSCYNRRSTDPEFARLTFCLLGAALPSDLIRDPRLTPFNIGQHIELRDFLLSEMKQLEPGLHCESIVAEALLERVHTWTGGHPYLTQRLCRALSESPEIGGPEQVDRLCERLFLSNDAQEHEDNLAFVRDRLLGSLEDERDIAGLLTLFERIVSGRQVPDRKSDVLIDLLRLAGVVRTVDGALAVRNRIYAAVFDRRWIAAHMPGAERKRQREAYRRGVTRAAAVVTLLLAFVGSLVFTVYRERIHTAARDQILRQARQFNYAADMYVLQKELIAGNYSRAYELLDAHRHNLEEENLCGWEWRYFQHLLRQDRRTLLHEGKSIVFSVRFSPDGGSLVSAKGDGTIDVWNPITGGLLKTLRTHTGLFSTASAPDGKTFASAGGCNTITLWDAGTWEATADLSGHRAEVRSVAISADGRRLASSSSDGEICLWDIASRRMQTRQATHKSAYIPLAFSPDGRCLVSGGIHGTAVLWDLPRLRPVFSFPVPLTTSVYSVTFSPDSKLAALGIYDGSVELWDVAARRKTATLRGHSDCVNGLAFSPDGRFLATGSWDDTIRLWNIAERKTVHAFIGHNAHVTSVAFTPDGRWIASGSSNQVKIWDARHWEQNPRSRKSFADLRTPLDFSDKGTLQLFRINEKKRLVTLWDDGTRRAQLSIHTPESPDSAAVTRDGRTLAIGSDRGTVALWDTASRRQIKLFYADVTDAYHGVRALAFSPDGKRIATGSGDDAIVAVWDIASGRKLASFAHTNTPAGIAFSRDGKMLAAANWQGRVYLLTLSTAKVVMWRAHTVAVEAVAFSPDGKTLATASLDKTVKLWNLATLREMATLTEPHRRISSIAFSPDGAKLTGCAVDRTIWTWDASEPVENRTDVRRAER